MFEVSLFLLALLPKPVNVSEHMGLLTFSKDAQ